MWHPVKSFEAYLERHPRWQAAWSAGDLASQGAQVGLGVVPGVGAVVGATSVAVDSAVLLRSMHTARSGPSAGEIQGGVRRNTEARINADLRGLSPSDQGSYLESLTTLSQGDPGLPVATGPGAAAAQRTFDDLRTERGGDMRLSLARDHLGARRAQYATEHGTSVPTAAAPGRSFSLFSPERRELEPWAQAGWDGLSVGAAAVDVPLGAVGLGVVGPTVGTVTSGIDALHDAKTASVSAEEAAEAHSRNDAARVASDLAGLEGAERDNYVETLGQMAAGEAVPEPAGPGSMAAIQAGQDLKYETGNEQRVESALEHARSMQAERFAALEPDHVETPAPDAGQPEPGAEQTPPDAEAGSAAEAEAANPAHGEPAPAEHEPDPQTQQEPEGPGGSEPAPVPEPEQEAQNAIRAETGAGTPGTAAPVDGEVETKLTETPGAAIPSEPLNPEAADASPQVSVGVASSESEPASPAESAASPEPEPGPETTSSADALPDPEVGEPAAEPTAGSSSALPEPETATTTPASEPRTESSAALPEPEPANSTPDFSAESSTALPQPETGNLSPESAAGSSSALPEPETASPPPEPVREAASEPVSEPETAPAAEPEAEASA